MMQSSNGDLHLVIGLKGLRQMSWCIYITRLLHAIELPNLETENRVKYVNDIFYFHKNSVN